LFRHDIKQYSSEVLPSGRPIISVYKQTFLANKNDYLARTYPIYG